MTAVSSDTAMSLVEAVTCHRFTGWKRNVISDGEEFLRLSPSDRTQIYAIVAYPNSSNNLARVRQSVFFTSPDVGEIHVVTAAISSGILTVTVRTCEQYTFPICEARE